MVPEFVIPELFPVLDRAAPAAPPRLQLRLLSPERQ